MFHHPIRKCKPFFSSVIARYKNLISHEISAYVMHWTRKQGFAVMIYMVKKKRFQDKMSLTIPEVHGHRRDTLQ